MQLIKIPSPKFLRKVKTSNLLPLFILHNKEGALLNLRLYIVVLSLFVIATMFFNGVLAIVFFKNFKTNSQPHIFENPTSINDNSSHFTKNSLNILILGGDQTSNNTDTIILTNIDFTNNKFSFLSIPRDTKISDKDNTYKINTAYQMGGAKKVLSIINNLLGINISYYIHFDQSAFIEIIDILGGVTITIPEALYYEDPTQDLYIKLPKGRYVLDGKQAESFVRFRKFNSGKVTENFDGSDLKRIRNQQTLIEELISQKMNLRNISRITYGVNILLHKLDTNITSDILLEIINNSYIFDKTSISTDTLKGTVKYIDNISYFVIEKQANKELIEKNFF